MNRRRLLLAFWLAIQLLSAQQVALAHLVGHLGEMVRPPAPAAQQGANDDDKRGAVHALADVCTTCVGCAAFDAAPAATAAAPCAFGATAAEVAVAVVPAPTLPRLPAFQSRAPPSLHD